MAILQLIDEMVNHEIMKVTQNGTYHEFKFHGVMHQKFFNIILVDLLSEPNSQIVGAKEHYTEALQWICRNPQFDSDGSINSLNEASQRFNDWLEDLVEFTVVTQSDKCIRVKRKDYLMICGNMSKHNIAKLSRVVEKYRKILADSEIDIDFDGALESLEVFYETYSGVLNYHGGRIAELLNNIRIGIHSYLKSKFLRSYTPDRDISGKYSFDIPIGIQREYARKVYWDFTLVQYSL